MQQTIVQENKIIMAPNLHWPVKGLTHGN